MKNRNFFAIIFLCLCASGCRVLSDSQVTNINAFSTSTKAYSQFPGLVIKKRIDLIIEEKLVGVIGQRADAVETRLANIQETALDQENLAEQIDISIQLIQQYASLLAKLSADTYVEDLNKNVSSLNDNLSGFIETANKKLTNKIPTSVSKAVTQAIFLVGKRLTKRKQTKALKEFIPAGDSLIQTAVQNLVTNLEVKITPILAGDKGKFKSTFTASILQDRTLVTYPNLNQYYNGLNNYDNLAKLNVKCIESAKKLAIAHGKLTADIASKKSVKDIFKETQELITSVSALYKILKSFSTPTNS